MTSDNTLADLAYDLTLFELSAARECVAVYARWSEGGPHHELVCAIERELADILQRIDAAGESLQEEGQR